AGRDRRRQGRRQENRRRLSRAEHRTSVSFIFSHPTTREATRSTPAWDGPRNPAVRGSREGRGGAAPRPRSRARPRAAPRTRGREATGRGGGAASAGPPDSGTGGTRG